MAAREAPCGKRVAKRRQVPRIGLTPKQKRRVQGTRRQCCYFQCRLEAQATGDRERAASDPIDLRVGVALAADDAFRGLRRVIVEDVGDDARDKRLPTDVWPNLIYADQARPRHPDED